MSAPDCPICKASSRLVEQLGRGDGLNGLPLAKWYCNGCCWYFALNDAGECVYSGPTQHQPTPWRPRS